LSQAAVNCGADGVILSHRGGGGQSEQQGYGSKCSTCFHYVSFLLFMLSSNRLIEAFSNQSNFAMREFSKKGALARRRRAGVSGGSHLRQISNQLNI
jgi:hypothetical protein